MNVQNHSVRGINLLRGNNIMKCLLKSAESYNPAKGGCPKSLTVCCLECPERPSQDCGCEDEYKAADKTCEFSTSQ
jgi:hypothetical protein